MRSCLQVRSIQNVEYRSPCALCPPFRRSGRISFQIRPLLQSRFRNLRQWAVLGDDDDPIPEEDTALGSFFEEDDSETLGKLREGLSKEEGEEDVEEEEEEEEEEENDEENEEEEFEDVTSRDKLAYERLIIEGADVEDAEDDMKDMYETLKSVEDRYLSGNAYNSAQDPPPTPIKKLEDFDYSPMPEFKKDLVDLLEEANLKEQAEYVNEKWGAVKVTGMQSRVENVRPGDLYFALRTDDFDGVRSIPQAIEQGAVGIVLEVSSEDIIDTTLTRNGASKAKREEIRAHRYLQENGIEDVENKLPIVPVESLNPAMSQLGCVFYDYPSSMMKIVGVVGSHGKTSTAWILRQIVEEFSLASGMMCDIEYAIAGDRLTEEGDLFVPDEEDPTYFRKAAAPYHLTPFKGRYSISDAVPDPLQVQKVLAGMAHRGALVCLIECPLHVLADERLTAVDFDVMIFTNLESDSEDTPETFGAKKTVCTVPFRQLTEPERQRAIINIDDPHAQDFIDPSSEVPVVTYSMALSEADVYLENASFSAWESELVVQTPVGKMQIITPLITEHQAYNILASVAAAVSMDIDLPTIVAGVESIDFIPGRYEVVDEGQEFPVVVDCANNPERLTSLITNLKACQGIKRVFLVFGCSFYHSREERAEIGSAAHYHADFVIFTSDSPGSESPDSVIDDIVAGFPEEVMRRSSLWVLSPWQDPGRVPWWFEEWLFDAQSEVKRYVVEDRSLAIRGAIGTAKKGDVVVIAGRGDRDFSWWVDKDDQPFKAWYEDRKEVRDALTKLPHLRKSQVVTDHLPWEEPEVASSSNHHLSEL